VTHQWAAFSLNYTEKKPYKRANLQIGAFPAGLLVARAPLRYWYTTNTADFWEFLSSKFSSDLSSECIDSEMVFPRKTLTRIWKLSKVCSPWVFDLTNLVVRLTRKKWNQRNGEFPRSFTLFKILKGTCLVICFFLSSSGLTFESFFFFGSEMARSNGAVHCGLWTTLIAVWSFLIFYILVVVWLSIVFFSPAKWRVSAGLLVARTPLGLLEGIVMLTDFKVGGVSCLYVYV